MDMTFQFLLDNTPIKQTEAEALLATTNGAMDGSVSIELTKLFDLGKLDSQRLFELSVKNQNQALASLAWKISVQNSAGTKTSAKRSPAKPAERTGAHTKMVSSSSSVDELIDKLHSHNSYWSGGAALLLAESSKGEWVTLREIATTYVNHVWQETEALDKCLAFRGFMLNSDTLAWEPQDQSPTVERRNSYHVSPLYIGLREGLLWCRNHGLMEQKHGLSVGSNRAGTSHKAAHMQRVYYRLRASEKGKEMVRAWGDIYDYVDNVFTNRSA
jgi:hypothetical protein